MTEQEETAGLVAKAQGVLATLRQRVPLLDHALRMNDHYNRLNGSIQAGGITYFAFLSFFPILAVAFFAIGYVSMVWPDARANLTAGIEAILAGMVGDGDNQISLEQIERASATLGLIGLVGLLYTGLGWLSAMRGALLTMFELPTAEKPNFVVGKLRDLLTLGLIGTVLVVSVAVSSVVSSLSADILAFLGVGSSVLGWSLKFLTVAVGLGSSMVLFYAIFRLLAKPDLPSRALWSGALLGSIGFEVLKRLATLLMASTSQQPAFQAFGIALILLVWMYYFSQIILYAAVWAQTAVPSATASADDADEESDDSDTAADETDSDTARFVPVPVEGGTGTRPGVLLAVGALAGAVLARLLRGRGD